MQGYLLRPDFFEKVNGILDNDKQPLQRVGRDKACLGSTVPRFSDGSQLQAWAIAQGLPTAPVGLSTTQYYQLLCHVVEKQRITQERDLIQ